MPFTADACIDGQRTLISLGVTKVVHKHSNKGVGVVWNVNNNMIYVKWGTNPFTDSYSRWSNKSVALWHARHPSPAQAAPASFGLNERAHISLAAGQKKGPWLIVAENGALGPAPKKAYPTEEGAYAVANIMAEKYRKRFYVCHIRGYAEPAANVRTERF